MQVMHVNGCDMAYAERGEGTPLLLVHGSILDLRYWAPQIDAFGLRYRTIAVSLRHCWPARWDGLGDDYTAQRHTEDVAALIAALGAGPAHLLGHSRGGYVAFHVARRFPDRVRALVLAEPGGALDASLLPEEPAAAAPAPAPPLDGFVERVRRGDVEGGLAGFVDAVSGPGAWAGLAEEIRGIMRDNARTLLGQAREVRPPYGRADAAAIRAPTLLVGGERSPPPFARILGALERAIPDARRATVRGAGHLMSREDPDAFNAAVLDFLASR
jgi:pimeloyl-ACP methyl ester carboxylesterase